MLSYQMGRRVLVGVALFSLVLASLMFTSRSSTKQTVQLSLQQDIPDDRSKVRVLLKSWTINLKLT